MKFTSGVHDELEIGYVAMVAGGLLLLTDLVPYTSNRVKNFIA